MTTKVVKDHGQYNIAIRAYSKTELALLYFPHLSPEQSRARLMRAVKQVRNLPAKLRYYGLSKYQKLLTPQQIRCILEYYGEPDLEAVQPHLRPKDCKMPA